MPFGLKNAPGTFQNLMRHVLADHWGEFAIAYLDDIIVYSKNWQQHLLHLGLVFERLSIYGLTCSPHKCQFGQTSLDYLGHVVTSEGNQPQPKHLQAILDAEPPRTRKGLRSLLGTMNWLHEYIPHYSEIIASITDLLSPKRPYKWNKGAQEALETAKEAFRKHEPLSRPDPSLPFILQTDASARGMGAVLMQQGPDGRRRIIAYASAKFSPTEAAYHCNEQECLAIIWAITHFRPYLEDQRFILRTDSKTLTWLDRQKDTRDKLTRWHVFLSRYKFTIEHCPGKDNELPDALSRFPDPDSRSPGEPDLEQMIPPHNSSTQEGSAARIPVLHLTNTPSLFEEVIDAQLEDPDIQRDIHRWTGLDNQRQRTQEAEKFYRNHRLDQNGFWRLSTDQTKWLLLAPGALRQRIIWEYHDAPLSGHPGADETIRAISEYFIWPGMSREIRRYVSGCHLCFCCKPVRAQYTDHQRPRAARTAWDTVAVDLMGPYPRTSKGNAYVLVVTDTFSRWVEAFPIRSATATNLVKILEEEVFSRWGYPRRILSDNGTQFTGHTWAEASQRWDCELWTTPVYHPRANPTERRNQEIKKGLRLRLEPSNQRTSDQYLPELLFGLRRRQNAATGSTPSYLVLGKTIPLPGEWRLHKRTLLQPLENLSEARQQREEQGRQHQRKYQEKYASERVEPRYAVGSWVFTTNHLLSNKAASYNAALDHKRIGPFQISQHVSGDVYYIQKDGQEQKVHGRDLWKAPLRPVSPEPEPQPLQGPSHNHEVAEQPPPCNDHLSTSDKEEELLPATSVVNRIGEQPYPPPLDRAHYMPVEGIHAPGPSGQARPPTTASPQSSVAAQAHSCVQRKEEYEDEEQKWADASKEGPHYSDDARERYKFRGRRPTNYRDTRPYARIIHNSRLRK